MNLQPKLPVIDLSSKYLKQSTPIWISTCNTIRYALEKYGIFIIKYDKVSSEIHCRIFNLLKELFDLPKETKMKNTSDKLGFGYGANIADMLIEYLGIEGAATLEGTQKFTNLMWEQGNETFCEVALLYSKLLSELGQLVVRMVFESYGAEEHCKSHFESILYLMRFMKYELPPSAQSSDKNIGLHSHTDKNFWTILDQNLIKGLEIETKGGDWITFEPSPSTFLFIAGEPFTAWSNGRIHPAYHRVTITRTEPKYSIGLFAFARGVVTVPDVIIDDQQLKKFRPFEPMLFLKYCGEEGKKFKNPIIPYCGV